MVVSLLSFDCPTSLESTHFFFSPIGSLNRRAIAPHETPSTLRPRISGRLSISCCSYKCHKQHAPASSPQPRSDRGLHHGRLASTLACRADRGVSCHCMSRAAFDFCVVPTVDDAYDAILANCRRGESGTDRKSVVRFIDYFTALFQLHSRLEMTLAATTHRPSMCCSHSKRYYRTVPYKLRFHIHGKRLQSRAGDLT